MTELQPIKSEMFRIMQDIERDIDRHKLSKNLWMTQTLAWCFMVSAFQLIRAAFGCLGDKSILGYNVIVRSLIEQIVDQMYVVLHDDQTLNRRFANYPKLWLYWYRANLESLQSEVPQIESEYRTYVQTEFKETVDKYTKEEGSVHRPDWEKINGKLHKLYRGSFTTNHFQDRVLIVALSSLIKDKVIPSAVDWTALRRKLERTQKGNWPHLTFKERLALAMSVVLKQVDLPVTPNTESLDGFLEQATHFYEYNTLYTHPTPWSVVPHFSPASGTFELEYSYAVEDISEAAKFLYLCLDSTVHAFSDSLGSTVDEGLVMEFRRKFARSPILRRWLLNWFGEDWIRELESPTEES